ncbi:MAG: hypothetical protein JO142_12265 [Burkholderiales bacterium]|nr:hypothetical protein [Burkholderiales bacterium]
MATLKKLLIIVVAIAAIIAAIPLVIPYDNYRPKLQTTMSDRLQIPVTIGSIQFTYSPSPMLMLQQVTLGKNGEGTIGKVVVPLTLRNLLHIRSELTNVSIEDMQLQQTFARSVPSRLKPNPGGRDIRITSFNFSNGTIVDQGGQIGPVYGILKLNEDGTFKDVTIRDKEEHAELNIKPLNDKFALEFSAKNWVLPGKYENVRFDQLIMRGMADNNGVAIDDINGLIFGAPAVGQAQLTWNDGWKVTGTLETKGMQVEPLISLFSDNTRSTGRMAANASFQFDGTNYDTLFDHRQIQLNFTLTDGELHNFDLVSPLKSQNPSILQRGGQTRFDTLTGKLADDNGAITMKDLQLNGGKFSAVGALAIGDKRKLNGRITARLNSGAIAIAAPLSIAGTLDAPEIRSGGASKPGGAEGTTQIF